MAEPPAKKQRLNMAESFTVCVGEEAEEFVVIQSIATRSSKFFQAAISRDWKEAREKRVMLPDTKVEVFEGYLQWLYTGQITITNSDTDYLELVTLYIIGDFLDDVAFRNATLEGMISFFDEGTGVSLPGAKATQLAWDETPSNSPLRQLIMEMWSFVRFEDAIISLLEPDPKYKTFPREFVQQFFERFKSIHALDHKKSATKREAQVMAEFKLRLSGGTADGNKS